MSSAIPTSAGWREGDPAGHRQFATVGSLQPELGGRVIDEVQVAYETWGEPRRDAEGNITNAVLVEHALTGDSHVVGAAGPGHPTPGWWDGLIGPGAALDSDRWFVVCANVLGGCQGTTGPSSPAADGNAWGSRFPRITVRDQVEVERRLLAHLGVKRLASVIGGSMGGMRAIEWIATHPANVDSALILATSAWATADQIATQSAQILAITGDAHWHGGDYYDTGTAPHHGLGLARRIAHLTYRTESELDVRFGRAEQAGEEAYHPESVQQSYAKNRFAVQSYLDHHADKITKRFDAGSYVALTDAMTTHDVGRGRGGAAHALAKATMPVVVGGIDSDRLYPFRLQRELAAMLPNCPGAHKIHSPFGHDGFLLESEQVAVLLDATVEFARTSQ